MSFSRRPDPRFNRGRISTGVGSAAPSPPPTTAGTIAAAAGFTIGWNVRADLGVFTDVGVATWADQSGNGWHFQEPVGTQQPAYVASAVNGQPGVQADGVDDRLTNSFTRVAPGTTPFWIWMIAMQTAWVSLATLWNDGGATIYSNDISPRLRAFNGTNGAVNAGASFGVYKRFENQYRNTVADYLKIGSTLVGGTINTGNTASGANTFLFCAGGGIRFFNGVICEAVCGFGLITASLQTDLDAYASARYGAGVLA